MKNKILREVIDKATDRNVVVYDEKAASGELTEGLLDALSVNIPKLSNHEILTGIVVSAETVISNSVMFNYRDIAVFRIDDEEYRELKRYYLNTLGGTLANNDKELGVAIASDFTFVLFSY
jgi:hypothetical protein